MRFTVEEIKNLKSPYTDLVLADRLAKHTEELNQLEPDDKIVVATRMIIECPSTDIKALGHQLEALRSNPLNDKETFHSIARQAYEIKLQINSLRILKNFNPIDRVLNNEFNPEQFKKFSTLVAHEKSTLDESAAAILAFIEDAFNFKSKVINLLLSEQPSKFFTDNEFSVDKCLEFSGILSKLIKGKESDIGKALITTDRELNNNICKSLEFITPKSQDQNNSFRLIHEVMAEKLESLYSVKSVEELPITNPEPVVATGSAEILVFEIDTPALAPKSPNLIILPFLFDEKDDFDNAKSDEEHVKEIIAITQDSTNESVPVTFKTPRRLSDCTQTLFNHKKNQSTSVTSDELTATDTQEVNQALKQHSKKPNDPQKPEDPRNSGGSKKPNDTPPDSGDACCTRSTCSIL